MASNGNMNVLIHGFSIGSGGGYTVAREVLRNIALVRPNWTITISLTSGYKLHEEMRTEGLPDNCDFFWGPENLRGNLARRKYERSEYVSWAATKNFDANIQLNGMLIPGLNIPTLAHYQDPMPYRSIAWQGQKDRLIAFFKRRENKVALHQAAACGFTSNYLKDLICGHHKHTPKRCEVFYNGIPHEWIERADAGLPEWSSRPLDIATISNVAPYKQQEMVIRAMPHLIKHPGLEELKYRIIGQCDDAYRQHLEQVSKELGVSNNIVLEGRVSDERVQEVFSSSRAYVLMSLCESFGIPAIEAMSFGTPVVTSNCCAMPEVCGQAAELSDVDNVEELAGRIQRILTDDAHAEQMRTAGVQQMKRFDWMATGKQMAERLEDIVPGH